MRIKVVDIESSYSMKKVHLQMNSVDEGKRSTISALNTVIPANIKTV